jgi:glycosyltransferase involved in cell wall biosynthesis
MGKSSINIDNTVFVLLSFEGPDLYSQAGGLGVRVTHLSHTLSSEGFLTHLFFIGDPAFKGEEISRSGKLVLHRWCQWISAYHPAGVYQGEYEKLSDYTASIPEYLLEHIIKPASRDDKTVVVLAEEWHTAAAVCRLDQLLIKHRLRDQVVLFWNANNSFGFEHINFKDLARAATITTVSRFMKQAMWKLGLNPVVIPNGIPKNLLNRVDPVISSNLRKSLGVDLILTKIARWDPDKRWNMAVEAVARLKTRGLRTILLARGGMENYGEEVIHNARSLGLHIKDVTTGGDTLDEHLESISSLAPDTDILNLRFHCRQDLLRFFYHASNAVLANSGREPFGLVGLETMAAGGIAFTGSTGEDYAIPFHNSIVLETSDPEEIESYVIYLMEHPSDDDRIRKAARYTAARFTWEQVLDILIQRLEYQAKLQGILTLPEKKSLLIHIPAGITREFTIREPVLVSGTIQT